MATVRPNAMRSRATSPRLGLVLAACALLACASVVAQSSRVGVAFLAGDRAMLVIDGKNRLLRSGETSPEGVTLVSVGEDEAVLEIGGERRALRLGAHLDGPIRGPRKRDVRLYPTRNGMYLTSGTINGRSVEFIVDTGATLVSLNGNEARRLGIDFEREGQRARSNTAAGVSVVHVVTLDRVRVGDIELENVRGAVHPGDFPAKVLLGQSFLNRLDMNRDGTTLTLTLEY